MYDTRHEAKLLLIRLVCPSRPFRAENVVRISDAGTEDVNRKCDFKQMMADISVGMEAATGAQAVDDSSVPR